MTTAKAYKGLGMEGAIARWYTKNTGQDLSRFQEAARLVAERARPGSDLLEVAPGPGYFAIELAKRGYRVTTLDISESFVKIARKNVAKAGVAVDVRHGKRVGHGVGHGVPQRRIRLHRLYGGVQELQRPNRRAQRDASGSSTGRGGFDPRLAKRCEPRRYRQ